MAEFNLRVKIQKIQVKESRTYEFAYHKQQAYWAELILIEMLKRGAESAKKMPAPMGTIAQRS